MIQLLPRRRVRPPLPDSAGAYFVSDRVQASPYAMMGLEAPGLFDRPNEALDIRAMLPPPRRLAVGTRVEDESEPRKVYSGRWGILPSREREGLRFDPSPERVMVRLGESIWQVTALEGTRWVIRSGKPAWPTCDAYTVVAKLPRWRMWGPHGQAVEAILGQAAKLDAARVRALPPNLERRPGPAVDGDLRSRAMLAMGAVAAAVTNRGEAIDPDSGGTFEAFCYPSFILNDPHWQTALRFATQAIEAIAIPEAFDEPERVARIAPWRALVADSATGE
jgi:hypothetical protein